MIQPSSPSFKVAVLGSGRMGQSVIAHLHDSPLPVETLAYDLRPSALETVQSRFGIRGTRSLDAVLSDPSVRLVFVTASNASHQELVTAALKAGKAVMCEKPIATTWAASCEMVELAERLGLFFQIGFELRYSTLYTTIKRWIDEGKLGSVRQVQCNYIASEAWGKGSWRTRLESGGSLFGEKLSHYVDLPRWWIGTPVEEVYAASAPNVIPYYEVRDNYQTTCTFQGGAVHHLTFMMAFAARMEPGGKVPPPDPFAIQKDDGHELRHLVMGTCGGAEANVFHRYLRRWEYRMNDSGLVSRLVEEQRWEPSEDHACFHNTRDQTLDIVDRVFHGRPPRTAARDALETMRVCQAVEASLEERRAVRLACQDAHSTGLPHLSKEAFCI